MIKEKKPKLDPLLPEALSTASPERFGCQTCALFQTCKTPFIKPYVPEGWTGLLLIVGEGPGREEDEQGRPFVGAAGKLLRTLWREAGYNDVDVALTNAVRCRPRNNATPSMSQVRSCRAYVLEGISRLKPAVVVGVGGSALRSLTNKADANITGNRRRLLEVPGLRELAPDPNPRAYATYHPAAVLRGALPLRQLIVDDLKATRTDDHVPYPKDDWPTGKFISVDTEFDPSGKLLTLGISDGRVAKAIEVDECTGELQDTTTHSLSASLIACMSKSTVVGGHSLPQDLTKLGSFLKTIATNAGLEWSIPESWWTGHGTLDSLLLSRMVNENSLSYSLEDQLLAVLPVVPWKAVTEAYNWTRNERNQKIWKPDAGRWPVDLRKERCRLDAWAAAKLIQHYFPKLETKRPLIQFTHRVASTLERLSLAGAIVDLSTFAILETELGRKQLEAKDLLTRQAVISGFDGEFVPSNDTHLRRLLYGSGAYPESRYTESGLPSVDKVTLKQLEGDLPRLILDYNKAEKVYATYIDGVKALISPIGRVSGVGVGLLPFRFNPLGARTGRRSSYQPNSQNWPKSVRGMVRSRFVGGQIANVDYRRLEMVLQGWASGDDKLFRAFTVGRGYLDIAESMLGITVEEGTDAYRGVKGIVLGVGYGMGDSKLSRLLWEVYNVRYDPDYDAHTEYVSRLRRTYLRTYSKLSDWMERGKESVLRKGFVVSATGRVRHLPVPEGGKSEGLGHVLNSAINFPIQSLASDITGSALIDIESTMLADAGISYSDYTGLLLEVRNKLLTNPSDRDIMGIVNEIPISLIFNEVHDSLCIDLKPERAKRDLEIVVETMRRVPTVCGLATPALPVPFAVDVKVNPTWLT